MTTTTDARPPLPLVLEQHLDDTIIQRQMRAVLVRAPHVRLHLLARLDERLAASLDGLAVGGDAGNALCTAAMERPSVGAVFACAVQAIARQDLAALASLASVVEALPETRAGLTSAFGWVPAASLRGLTKALLDSTRPFERAVGLAACALHQVNPGAALDRAVTEAKGLDDAYAPALAAKLGRNDLLPALLALCKADAPALQFEAARAALLLGDRGDAVQVLSTLACQPGPLRQSALLLVVKVLEPSAVHALLKPLSQDTASLRLLLRATGAAGDVHYVPWLIRQMAEPKFARAAGEAFATITGADLAFLDLDRKPPEGVVFGPNDDPADAEVALDEDESVPWPDVERVGTWWQANGARFKPGTRCFVGEPPTVAHCISVLRSGLQRQRIAAAEYLCLLQPGTPLFNVAAPAWRQERLLAQMGD